MTDVVRILLVDDHTLLRSGLRLLLGQQPDFAIVGEAGSGAQALELAAALRPDVMLLDLNLPDGDGHSVLAKLAVVSPGTRALVLTMHEETHHLQAALSAGAAGYVLKRAVDTELVMAIRAVVRGEVFVHSPLTQALLAASRPETPSSPQDNPWLALSERELEVIRRVAQGYTNAEIAAELFLSTKTVETYRARSMEKLGMETRAQLVRSALKHGYLE